jgi:hypothetical protein
LASAPLPVAINTDYRLRLEAAGDRLRVFVNGVKVLEAHDAALSHGRAALITYMAKADFDNVVVTPSPSTPIYTDRFNNFNSVDWDETPTGVVARAGIRRSGWWLFLWPATDLRGRRRALSPSECQPTTKWCSSPPFRAALARAMTAGLA